MEIKQLKLNGTKFYPKVGVDSIVNADGTASAVDTVVTQGSQNLVTSDAVYDAIGGVPTPTEPVQSDWNQTNSSALDYIKNKPVIPVVPTLATVATTGSYNDLLDKPVIPTPTGQVQSNWNQTDSTQPDYIQNKPSLATVATSGSYNDLTNKPTIPTKTSDLTNDSSFVTELQLSGKQDALVSGTNIKTINNQSILGSGNIDVSGGGSGSVNSVSYSNNAGDFAPDANGKVTLVIDQALDEDSGKPVTNAATALAIKNKQDKLVSGTNIKTINGNDLLGSGNIEIGSGGTQVQSDWNESDSSSMAYILNKPTIPSSVIGKVAYSNNAGEFTPDASGTVTLTIDQTLDTDSGKPVTNAAISTKFNSIVDKFDSVVDKVVYSNNAGEFTPTDGTVTLTIDLILDADSGRPVTNAAISTKFNSVDTAISNVNSTVTNMTTTLVNHSNAITAIERVLWKDDENQIDKVNGRVDSLSSVVDSALTDIDDCVETIEISNNKLKYTTSGGVTPVDVATIDTVATKNSKNLVTSGAVLNSVGDSFGSKNKYFKGLGLSSVESVFDIQGQLIDTVGNTRIGYIELTIEWFNAKGDAGETDRLVKKHYVVGKEPVIIENSQWDPSGIISDINSYPGNNTDFAIYSQPSFTYSSSGGRMNVQIHLGLLSSKYQVHSITITKVYDPNNVELQLADAFLSTAQYLYHYTDDPQPGIYVIEGEVILRTNNNWYKIGDAEESPMKPNT